MSRKTAQLLGSAIGSALVSGALGVQYVQSTTQPQDVVDVLVKTIERQAEEIAECR